MSAPQMPPGFSDQAAWDAIHWNFSATGSTLDQAVMDWQRVNQERCLAASLAAAEQAMSRMALDTVKPDPKPVAKPKGGKKR
jgi:hypothetical protein